MKVGASGTYQTATGTTNWGVSGVTLVAGLNTVYAKATDVAGNTKETSITVTYNSTATPAPDCTAPSSTPTPTPTPFPLPSPCVPNITCADYSGLCGDNLTDNCGNHLTCSCPPPQSCYLGACLNPPPTSSIQRSITDYPNPLSFGSWPDLIRGATVWILGLVSSLVLLFLIIGGLFYLTSAGYESRIAFSKKTILSAIVGLIVIILAVVIVSEVKKML